MLLVVSVLNIMLLPDPARPDHESLVNHWRDWYLSDSTLFHSALFAQLARLTVAETELTPLYQKAYWYCYSEVVRDINRRFLDPSEWYSDESIHAVQAMAFHGDTVAEDSETPRSPAQGPLNGMQALDIYVGRLNPVDMHVQGLGKMLSIRGGISDIKFPGLGGVLS